MIYPLKGYEWVDHYFREISPQTDDPVLDEKLKPERDAKIIEFIKNAIPDSYIDADSKTLLINTLKAIKSAGSSPSTIFGLLLYVHEQKIETSFLLREKSFRELHLHYKTLKKAILTNEPYFFYTSNFEHPYGRRILSTMDTLDELFNNAASQYGELKKKYYPRGRGIKKWGNRQFMGLAFMCLASETDWSCDKIYAVIADLLSAFSGKEYDLNNVKQQIHSLGCACSTPEATPSKMAVSLRNIHARKKHF